MSYTELEHGYQDLRHAANAPQFYVGDDGNIVPLRSSVRLQNVKIVFFEWLNHANVINQEPRQHRSTAALYIQCDSTKISSKIKSL